MKPTIRPTKKQDSAWKAWYDPNIKFLGFGGGAGGGKSWMFCEVLLVQAYSFPGTRSFIGRNTLKNLMQSTYITWLKVCSHHSIPREDWKLNGQYNYIEFTNGSRIDLLDLALKPSDPMYEDLGSMEFTNGWIEEAGEVNPLAFDVLKSRVGRCLNDKYNITPKIALTFNPKKGWLYELMYRPWKNGTLPKHTIFIQSLYSDNPFTREEYGKMLSEITDTATRQRLMDGNWDYDDDPTCLLEYSAILDLFTNVIVDSNDKYLTCDVARYGSDSITFYFWRGLHVYKIIEKKKQGIDQTADDIRTFSRDERIPFDHILVDEDGVGGGVIDLIRGIHGFIANSAPLPEKGVLPNYQNLKAQCGYKIADLINDRKVRITCDDVNIKERIEDELQQLKTFNADKDGKKQLLPKDKVKEILGHSPDHSDAILMRAWFEIKRTFHSYDGMPTTRFAQKRN